MLYYVDYKKCASCICMKCTTFRNDNCSINCINNCSNNKVSPRTICCAQERYNEIGKKLSDTELRERFKKSNSSELKAMYKTDELSAIYKRLSKQESRVSWNKDRLIKEIRWL